MTPLLEFDRVSKWFRDTVAVGDVSFSIEAGVTGLLGHNGAGKSTAIRLATGLARPDEGAVRVLGLGFERLVMICTGLENIRDSIPFPRYPGHCNF